MQLDKLNLVLRQRSAWEAFDAGILLYRRYAKAVYLAWACTVLPLAILLGFLFQNNLLLGSFIFWWLKPLFDRIPLLVYSQGIFGAPLTLGQTLRALPRACKTGLLGSLTLTRFSLRRSFVLPILQLEGLRGKHKQNRLQALSRHSGGQYTITKLCLSLEFICQIGLLFLVFIFLPIEADWAFYLESWWNWLQIQNTWFEYLSYALYVLIVSVIEPLYIACGFSLYLSRRTVLEGWDLEIGFRRLAQRLNLSNTLNTWLVVILLAMGLTGFAPRSEAANKDPQAELQTVLKSKPFDATAEIETQKIKKGGWLDKLINAKEKAKKPEKQQEPSTKRASNHAAGQVAAGGLWYLLVGAGIVLLLLIIYQFFKKTDLSSAKSLPEPDLPAQVAGMSLQQPLPSDIISTAQQLWAAGEHRQALALLYRGSLVHLSRQYALNLKSSFTEGDCLRQVKQACPSDIHAAFKQLNRIWLQQAYAQQTVSTDAFDAVCQSYRQHLMGGKAV